MDARPNDGLDHLRARVVGCEAALAQVLEARATADVILGAYRDLRAAQAELKARVDGRAK